MRVAPHHAESIGFVKGVCDEDRWIDINVIDFAQGGLGFIAEIFVPRQVDLQVQILDGSGSGEGRFLDAELRVQRVQMTDRRPAYKVGGAFVNLTPEVESQIERLLDRLGDECDHQGGTHA